MTFPSALGASTNTSNPHAQLMSVRPDLSHSFNEGTKHPLVDTSPDDLKRVRESFNPNETELLSTRRCQYVKYVEAPHIAGPTA